MRSARTSPRLHAACVVTLALLALGTMTAADAQWKWRDPKGVIQYSDIPPPQGTPDKDILDRPKAVQRRLDAASAPAQGASAPAAQAASAPGGVDPELEARRRKAEIDRVEQANKDNAARRAEAERVAKLRAENCSRARGSLRALEDGQRLARTNDKGEREVLDDRMRAEETARVRAVIASDCTPQ